MKKEIRCDICGKDIKKRNDMNIRFFHWKDEKDYCNKCYREKVVNGVKYFLGYSPWRGFPFSEKDNKTFFLGLSIYSVIFIFLMVLYFIGKGRGPMIWTFLMITLLLGLYWTMFLRARKKINLLN